jgi:hypothetical protein
MIGFVSSPPKNTYHNYFRKSDVESLSGIILQAVKSAPKQSKISGPLPGDELGAANGKDGLRDAV